MGNCLITKLDEIVNDSNLLKVGEVKLHISATTSSSYAKINTSTSGTISVLTEGVYLTQGGQQHTSLNYGDSYFSMPSGEYDILLSNVYDIRSIEGFPKLNNDCSAFRYFANMYVFNSQGGLSGNLSDLLKPIMQDCTLVQPTNGVVGTLNDLPPVARNITFHSNQISGNINVLGSRTSLTALNIGKCAIEGSLESLVSAYVTNSKTTGNIQLIMPNTSVTFGTYSGFPDANCRLKWNGTAFITYQTGSDADIENVSKQVTIYAKGASASQISDWESKNNVVNVVS